MFQKAEDALVYLELLVGFGVLLAYSLGPVNDNQRIPGKRKVGRYGVGPKTAYQSIWRRIEPEQQVYSALGTME